MRRLPILLLLPFLAACGGAPAGPPAPPDAAADAAYALLTALDADAVAEAYARLDRYAYTAEVRLTVEDAEGRHTASRTLFRWPTRDGIAERVVAADSSGPLGAPWDVRLANPLPRLLSDDPPFLAPRSREQYRYAVRPDTAVGGRRLRVVEARLRPEAGDAQAVRRARYLLRPDGDEVLGVEVERASGSALFDEADRATVLLQQSPEGAAVPALAVVETALDVPGEAPRRLRIEQRFRELHRAE